MRTGLIVFKLIALLCGIFATTLTFGQQFYVWTGSVNGTNTQTAGNWTTNGSTPATTLPNGNDGGVGDVCEFNGSTGNLLLTYGLNGYPNTGFGTFGITYYMSPSQNHDVQIVSPVSPQSASLGVAGVDDESTSGATLTLGDFSANAWSYAMRPAAALHHYINNSSGMCIINPTLNFIQGGGNTYTMDFSGTGNWQVNNDLSQDDGGPANVFQQDGPGSVFWSQGFAPGFVNNSAISAIKINGGILFLKSAMPDNNMILNATITNATTFDFDPASSTNSTLTNQVMNGAISGVGNLIVNNGTLTLGGANIYTGSTTISNGTLVISGTNAVGGDLNVPGGTFVPGSSVKSFNVFGNMNIGSGTVVANLNKALSPSNTLYSVTGSINNSSGTLKLVEVGGPNLMVGDKFTIFSAPVGGMAVVTPGYFSISNNLAVDGSVTVTFVAPSPTVATTVSGGNFNLSWLSNYLGLHLQVQTNLLAVGLSNNWFTIPGTDAVTNYSASMIKSKAVFYRLAP